MRKTITDAGKAVKPSRRGSSESPCPECGARCGGRQGCQILFDEVLAREFGDYRYARIHRLTVDCYSLQHPADYMRSAKSFAAHLTGMHAALTDQTAEVNPLVQQWLNGKRSFERPSNPPAGQRGMLHIIHVHEATDPDQHALRVREWAESIWAAWHEYHSLAEEWIHEARGARDAV